MTIAIDIRNLTKSFGKKTAVDNISFQLNTGEVLGFLGPNGAGKSTTMKMLTGFLEADNGQIQILGKDLAQDKVAIQQQFGYLPEGAPCYPDMLVSQFLNYIAQIRGFRQDEKNKRIEKVIEQVQLQDVLYQPIDTLSKGFKRRVGLAQAIIHDPQILILDEPTDGLDPNQKHEVRNLIRSMAKDKAIILSTHVLDEVEALCTRAIIIADGKIIANAAPQILAAQSKTHNSVTLGLRHHDIENAIQTLQALNEIERFEILQQADSDLLVKLVPRNNVNILAQLTQVSAKQEWHVHELQVDNGRLDEYFREVTTSNQERTV